MRTYLIGVLRPRIIQCLMLMVCMFFVQTGCGGDSGNRITPPENPTPVPDPDSRTNFGGGQTKTFNNNNRRLER